MSEAANSANSANSASASQRPNWFRSAAHAPATAPSEATAVKVKTMPARSGRLPCAKERSPREKMKGRTGRMQGLSSVNMPPAKAMK
jgi:hypothetical protein